MNVIFPSRNICITIRTYKIRAVPKSQAKCTIVNQKMSTDDKD